VSKSVANPLSDKDSRPAASVAFFMGNRHHPRNGIRGELAAAPSTVVVMLANILWRVDEAF
jgi:hypothetical protein